MVKIRRVWLSACLAVGALGCTSQQSTVDGGSSDGGSVSCPPYLSSCSGVCVDTEVDPDHCGDCDIQCDQYCSAGSCTTSCPLGFVVCDGNCIDPTSNRTYCGANGDCVSSKAEPPASGTSCWFTLHSEANIPPIFGKSISLGWRSRGCSRSLRL